MNVFERIENSIKKLNEKYPNEIEKYKNIGNVENFNEIIKRIDVLKKFKIEFDNSYERPIYGITTFKLNDETYIEFCFHDFQSPDCEYDMEKYLKGINYNLSATFNDDFIDFEKVEEVYNSMKQIKNIIDDVIGAVSMFYMYRTSKNYFLSITKFGSTKVYIYDEKKDTLQRINREDVIAFEYELINEFLSKDDTESWKKFNRYYQQCIEEQIRTEIAFEGGGCDI